MEIIYSVLYNKNSECSEMNTNSFQATTLNTNMERANSFYQQLIKGILMARF